MILQQVTSDFTTSNKQRVNFNEQQIKSYASRKVCASFIYENLQLYLRLGLKLKKNISRIRIQSITMLKIIY